MEFLFSASKIQKQHLNNKALQEIDLNKFLIKNNQSCNQTYQAHPFWKPKSPPALSWLLYLYMYQTRICQLLSASWRSSALHGLREDA